MKTYYPFVQAGFALLTIIFYLLLLHALRMALQRSDFPEERRKKIFRGTVIGLLLWMVVVSALSLSGILSDFKSLPPRLFIVLLVPLVVIIWLTSTKTMGEIIRHVPQHHIIRLQGFRFFVEILLWMLFIDNLLPVQMTFEGRNFDVLSGLTAPVVAWMAQRGKASKTFLVVWNLICLGLLINIVTTAVLSLPTPFRVFMNEPANTIVAKFPIVWLPAFLVPLAYGLHFLSLKKLGQKG